MDIKEQLSQALKTSLETVFKSTLDVPIEIIGDEIKADPATQILFCSKLSGIPDGFLTLSVVKEDFCKITSKLLEKEVTEFSNESNNSFGEFIKSIAEEVKKQLADTPYDFTVAFPQILTDEEFKMFANAETASFTTMVKTDFCEFGVIFLYRDASKKDEGGEDKESGQAQEESAKVEESTEASPEAEQPAVEEPKEEAAEATTTEEEKADPATTEEPSAEEPAQEVAAESNEEDKASEQPAEVSEAQETPSTEPEEKTEDKEAGPKVILDELEKEDSSPEEASSPEKEEAQPLEESPQEETKPDQDAVPSTEVMSEAMQKLDEVIKELKKKDS